MRGYTIPFASRISAEVGVVERTPLDAIDRAYAELESPLIIAQRNRDASATERETLLQELIRIGARGVALLPAEYRIEFVGPCFSVAPPSELAHWADDGGRV